MVRKSNNKSNKTLLMHHMCFFSHYSNRFGAGEREAIVVENVHVTIRMSQDTKHFKYYYNVKFDSEIIWEMDRYEADITCFKWLSAELKVLNLE